MKSLTAVALALAAPVQAGLRFGCSTLTIQRLDPVVEPGANPSAHIHHIVGGNAFNATMVGDVGERGTCTTCEMAEDFSNYWTAVMYFRHPQNGSYHRVPVKNNAALAAGTTGGMTIYYTQHDFFTDDIEKNPIQAFLPGFRMTVGNPATSDPTEAQENVGLRYNCLTTLLNRGPEMANFPDRKCPGGIFAVHHFPACWDGKNLDSANHQDHMYNTMRVGGFVNAPACPPSHPVRMPQVTYETVWDTTVFDDLWDEEKDEQPFVWSYIGTEGYGTHADYMFGWQGDSLQKAMDTPECFYDGCGSIKKQTMDIANKCTVPDMVGEEFEGWLEAMPGQSPM